jgi:hypothetical protein
VAIDHSSVRVFRMPLDTYRKSSLGHFDHFDGVVWSPPGDHQVTSVLD